MLQDIGARVATLGPVGAILIGGDVAFKAAPEEYRVAMDWILELVSVAQCSPELVFVVPGNHDVDRRTIANTPAVRNAQAAIAIAQPDRRERNFRTQINDRDTAASLLAPLAAYNDFAKAFSCQVYLPGNLYWKQDLKLYDGVTLRLHGLTSTLLSGADGTGDSRQCLYLSPLQTVLDPRSDVVNLVLCHHPPEWLMDQDDADDAISSRAAIHMFGHSHRQRITQDARYVRFSAGAVNPERNEAGWQPGYNLVELNVAGSGEARTLTVAAHLRQFQSSPEQFRAVLTSQGEEVFRHSIPLPSPGPGKLVSRGAAGTQSGAATHLASAAEPTVAASKLDCDVETAMGDANTRNLVFRFWQLTASERREIMLGLQLVGPGEISLPEPERYGRGLTRAGERDQLAALAREIEKRESA